MVKKLFKHEFLAYTRVMHIVYIILLTIAAAGRVVLLFEDDSIPYKIISVVSLITYGMSVFVTFSFVFVWAIIRFYKNLFTSEGYLTFTLPVTSAQHILVKAVTAVSMELVTLVAILLSGCILTSGELLVEIWKAIVYILELAYAEIGFQMVLIGGELAVIMIVALFSGILLYYTFISIGQLFKKNRILAAVGAYFVYYLITQAIWTAFSVAFPILATTGVFDAIIERIGMFAEVHPFVFIHSVLGIYGLLPLVFGVVEFFVVKKIITNKLNLE